MANEQTYPRVIAAIPDDGMYLVALDQDWGRILNRRRQWYWPTEQINVMTGPWEFLAPDAISPEMLADWIAQAQDMEAGLPEEQRERREQQRRQETPASATVTAAARTGNGPTTYGVLAALDTGEVAMLPADPHYHNRLVNSVHNTAADRSARTFIATLPQRWDNPYCWAFAVEVQEAGAIGPDTTRIQLPLQPQCVHRFLGDVLFTYAWASAAGVGEGRAARPEAQADQRVMRKQITQRIEEVQRQAQTMADVPGWLVDLAVQLGIEP